MDERLQQFETKMEKTCEYLEADFMTIRAGRANPHVLDKIRGLLRFSHAAAAGGQCDCS